MDVIEWIGTKPTHVVGCFTFSEYTPPTSDLNKQAGSEHERMNE